MRFTPKRPRTWRAGAAEKVLDLVCILFSDKAKVLYRILALFALSITAIFTWLYLLWNYSCSMSVASLSGLALALCVLRVNHEPTT